MGEVLYEAPYPDGLIGGTPVSYEESVSVNDNRQELIASRINYRIAKATWNTKHKLPFEILSDTKKEYTLLDNSTNIWKYKLDLLYYDGTKKDYTFYLNIENGEISDTL